MFSSVQWQRRGAAIFAGVLIAGLTAVLFWFDPAQSGFYPRCMLHQFTGWNCAGCGSLRAAHHLLHGELLQAVRCNLLFVAGVMLAVYWLGTAVRRRHPGRPFALRGFDPLRATWLLLAVTLAFSLVRNLPFAACAWLNP